MNSAPGPTAAGERIVFLDAVRGVALGGILLANLMSFFAAGMLDRAARLELPWGTLGEGVLFAINWLVEGKFYSVFSILLGAGFVLQAQRASSREEFERFFRRRMGSLAVIGLTHMVLFWAGVILTVYGLLGLLLPWLWRLSGRTRAALILVLLLIPLGTHVLVVASDGRLDPRAPFAAASAEVRDRIGVADRESLDLFARGSVRDYAAWNVPYAMTRPGTYLQGGRPAKVLALFLLGAWLAAFVLPRLDDLRRSLIAVAVVGGALGLVSSAVYASIKMATGSTFMVSDTGLLQTIAYTLGTTPLALAYLAAAVLAWRTRAMQALLAWFAPLGRMALTVYLTQTILQILAFTGVGFGLAGRASFAWLPVVAAAILIVQRYACVFWLERHPQGPAEWFWRRFAYGPRSAGRS